jgi:hypothetical protein
MLGMRRRRTKADSKILASVIGNIEVLSGVLERGWEEQVSDEGGRSKAYFGYVTFRMTFRVLV